MLKTRWAKTGASAAAVTMALTGCTGARGPVPFEGGPPVAAAATGLTAFDSCASLLSYIKAHAQEAATMYATRQRGPSDEMTAEDAATMTAGAGVAVKADSAPSTTAPSFSTTNVQERDVDEPDTVKTDGKRMFVLTGDTLRVLDVTKAQPALLTAYGIPTSTGTPTGLLVRGDRVVVFTSGMGGGGDVPKYGLIQAVRGSAVTVVDVADTANPRLVATMEFDADYVSARLSSGVVRLVLSQRPSIAVGQTLADTTVDDWLPTYTLYRPGHTTETQPLSPCSSVTRPEEFSGLSTVSVLTIDPSDPKAEDAACVLGAGDIVYASPQNLYVSTGQEIHQFSTKGAEPARYAATGAVDGTIINQFALSEHEGRLRVATTKRPSFGPGPGAGAGAVDNVVTILESHDGKLLPVGKVSGLGHAGETIQSVRYMGDRAYVVTFRQTDPLYVLDLSDPYHPVARGELQVPGFSSYLHPLSSTSLLGVGQGPGDGGGQGLQVSLFDVADPARPVRLDNKVFTAAGSVAQYDHHALTWWPATKQVFLPLYGYERGMSETGLLAMGVDPGRGFTSSNTVPMGGVRGVQRTVVVGDRLYSVTDNGVVVNGLADLAQVGSLAWR